MLRGARAHQGRGRGDVVLVAAAWSASCCWPASCPSPWSRKRFRKALAALKLVGRGGRLLLHRVRGRPNRGSVVSRPVSAKLANAVADGRCEATGAAVEAGRSVREAPGAHSSSPTTPRTTRAALPAGQAGKGDGVVLRAYSSCCRRAPDNHEAACPAAGVGAAPGCGRTPSRQH